MDYAIGIDLGGSSVKAVGITTAGEVFARENVDFAGDQELDWAHTVRKILQSLSEKQGNPPVSVGLSAPGLAARDSLSIAFMPGRLHGLEGLNWTEFLKNPTAIPVLNDAHAALVGEQWVGAARGVQNVIMLTLGTGVGGAAIVDGHLLKGHIGRAGHLGHNCLDPDGPRDVTGIPGSIEVLMGNYTIRERTKGRFPTTHALIKAFEEEDEEATKYWLISVKALACSVASFINILDPERVIIGGGIARAGRSLFDPLERFLRPIEWQPGGQSVAVVPAQLGEFAGAIGAARNGLTFQRP